MSETNNIRYVVFHTPGPRWQQGIDFREQPGVMDHVLHYRQLLEQGKLEMGGSFLAGDRGGMMVTVQGVSRAEIETFAAADPAIHSGLLGYEVITWYTAMQRST
jgi:uncharacterized protein YciI